MKRKQEASRAWPDPRKYSPRSLRLFSLQNPLRKLCIRGIEWKWWDRIVLFVIALNTVQLAMIDPFDVPSMRACSSSPSGPYGYCGKWGTGKTWPPAGRDFLDLIGKFFSAFFVLECVAKIIALGLFWGSKTYLAELWNWLDFVVVIIGILDFIPSGGQGSGNLSALRSLRVLRPLRAVNKFPELKFLVVLLLQCLPALGNVIGVCLFIFFVFGILGVQLFSGLMRGVCFDIDTGVVSGDGSSCWLGPRDTDEWVYFWASKGMDVTSGSHSGGMFQCSVGQECLLLGENPGRGAINFDSIGGAITTIFQVMTLEGWTDICYQIQDTVGFWNFLYFVLLVSLGPFFAVQLFLVVIAMRYSQLTEEYKNKSSEVKVEKVVEEFIANPAEGKSAKVAPESSVHSPLNARERFTSMSWDDIEARMRNGGSVNLSLNQKTPKKTGLSWLKFKLRLLAKSPALTNFILGVITVNTVCMATGGICTYEQDWCPGFHASLQIMNLIFTACFVGEMLIKMIGLGTTFRFPFLKYFQSGLNIFDFVIVMASVVELPSVISMYICFTEKPTPSMLGQQVDLSDVVQVSPDTLTPQIRSSLIVPKVLNLTGVLSMNPLQYYNCDGNGATSVLRAFRLVRLTKFLRAMPDLQKQIRILGSVMKSVSALIGLILMMLLIYTILGMNVLGGKMIDLLSNVDLQRGSAVYVQFPWDMNGGEPRHGIIKAFDFINHSQTPWHVYVEFGDIDPVVNRSLGGRLDSRGMIWSAVDGDPVLNVPKIVSASPRFHFDDLGHAFLTSFQVMTIANWNDDMYTAVANAGAASGFWFYSLIVFGNWILFNLFVAILIQKFGELKAQAIEQNEELMQKQLMEKLGHLEEGELGSRIEELFTEIDKDGSGEIDVYEFNDALVMLGINYFSNKPRDLKKLVQKYDTDGTGRISFDEFVSMIVELLAKARITIQSTTINKVHLQHRETQRKIHQQPVPVEVVEKKSCFCFPPNSIVRKGCKAVMVNKYFERYILLCILMSTICLAIQNPYISDTSVMSAFLNNANYILNASFTLEMIFKIVALSFPTYIKSGWNRLDFFLVVTSDIDVLFTVILSGLNVNLGALKIFRIFRIFRALRPLRILSRAKGLRVLVMTMASAVKPLMNTGILCVAFCIVFGILGMQLLEGKIVWCSDPTVWTMMECVGLDSDGNARQWTHYSFNFDNLGSAILTQLMLASQDNWPNHFWSGADTTSKITGPEENNQLFMASIFYIVSLLVAGAVIVNMVVGVFVDCYFASMEDYTKTAAEPTKIVLKLPEVFDDPTSGIRLKAFRVISHSKFDLFIAFFIITNVLTMSFESFKPSDWQNRFQKVCNFFFTFIFGGECVLKILAFHPKRYFRGNWNKFDFFIVMTSFIGIMIDNAGAALGFNPTILRILRIFRIFRILRAFRIFKTLKGLQAIVATLGSSLPAIGNLVGGLCLLFFIFGVLGVNLFGSMCVSGDEGQPDNLGIRCMFTDPDYLLERHAHFQGVGMALLTLFRTASGDNWGALLPIFGLAAPARTPVPQDVWDLYVSKFGYDPSAGWKLHASANLTHFSQHSSDAAMYIAANALLKRNESMTLYGEDTENWMNLAQLALPMCLTDSEASFLEEMGLMNCSTPGQSSSSGYVACVSSCGPYNAAAPAISSIYFYLFYSMSGFILLNIVIGVLMDQLENAEDTEKESHDLVPNAKELSVLVFNRIYRRWHFQARRFAMQAASHHHQEESPLSPYPEHAS